jgi:hypothetical protein
MDPSLRFRINTPAIVHETIEEEVVIINLENGNYYSLDGMGAKIWGSVGRGASVGEIVGELDNQYHANRAQIGTDVERFLAELWQDALIVSDEIETSRIDHAPKTQMDEEKLDFEAPVLNRYTDMQDLLLLDPIHDVDEAGWPTVAPETSID